MTVSDLAYKLYPRTQFDCALPQAWVDDCIDKGFDPRGHFVWGYPRAAATFGMPLPLTEAAHGYLSHQNALCECAPSLFQYPPSLLGEKNAIAI